ncbi:carbohydrate ABC transporter permease [Schleiferilactobacillus harbinensis]|jgi:putative aldouronate transport system permease protein|uniref:ABC transporter permease subunit n=1 Tax=Schleiferilactobacillus harbinensis TaxID=304207 RepID=A0A510TSI7_9LACO|nr:carbohydrate ABC transporter permease [Schleiferilactobacillus harbinensis]MCI1686989.1 carbohydrate ABC transporter permease [Schleiferilactobacillus harbinensis]MCI1784320.1 carbohydrate ABC transporter permease [Schleiferilactobacillus harbinensis]MCI1850938.1 carbohydrate ABC transporter permease [Schleiferilactobacillus harbinensis]MCT2908646.1 carbohydrate ABC transporter permease [Schleiferilactobacillus harbinensis]QFR24730.1 ABC transporter permease subunit [Schleiferilactobacillus
MVRSKSLGSRLVTILIYALMILAAFLSLAPLVNTIAISFSSGTAAASGSVNFIPVQFSWQSYAKIIADHAFWQAFGVSVMRVLVGGSLSLVLTVLMAFPLSRSQEQFPARNIYMWVLIFAMLFSGGMIPTYMVVYKLGLINSFWSLVLPGAVNIWNVILMMNFFKGIPNALEEAAVIDGASPLQILLKIYLPLAIPSLATITLFTVVGYWNDFFSGLIYINDQTKIPLQTYLQQLSIQAQNLTTMSKEEIMALARVSSLSLNSAKILVSMIPILLIYPLMQRFLVKGLVLGAVKE